MASKREGQIELVGLREFRASLKKVDAGLPKMLKQVGNEAAQIVVDAARPRIPLGPAKGGHVASSLKASSTGTMVRVSFGGARYPYAAWLDFGGRVGRKKRTLRPFLKSGRYVWKAFKDHNAEVKTKLEEGLKQVAERAGLDME